MSRLASLVAHIRGCPADCTFWAGDAVEYRDRRDGRPWYPTGVVLGPSTLAHPDPDEDEGGRIVREALLSAVGAAGRVRVEWQGIPDVFGHVMDLPARQLRHHGPCPPTFTAGETAILSWAVLGTGALLREDEVVRVTGVAPSGIIAVQTPDGRHGETFRSRLQKPASGSPAP